MVIHTCYIPDVESSSVGLLLTLTSLVLPSCDLLYLA